MLADVLNDNRTTLLKKALTLYNKAAEDSASGQLDIFSGDVRSQDDILNEVRQLLQYGTEEEQQAAIATATEERVAAAQEDGTTGAVREEREATVEDLAAQEDTPEETALRARIEELTDEETTEEGENGVIYHRPILIDGTHRVEQVDAPDGKGNYNGSYYLYDGQQFAGIPEVVAYIDGQAVSVSVAQAESEVNTSPTPAQKEAGNYKKGHVRIDGFDVTIENPRGSERSGTDASGKEWRQVMNNTYGYIRGTEGVDGDHIDVFLSDNPESGEVFVVDQVNKDGSFDEHKVMYGFPDIENARKAYLSNYEEGWQGLGAITPVSKEEFKKWIESSHRKTKPFAEYSSVKTLGDTQLGDGAAKESDYHVGDQFDIVDDNNRSTQARITSIDEQGNIELVIGWHGDNYRKTVSAKELDDYREREQIRIARDEISTFIANVVDDGDYSFVDRLTPDEVKALKQLVDEWDFLESSSDNTGKTEEAWGKLEEFINRMRAKYPVVETESIEPQPIGVGAFGEIYDQFKGKAKEAIDFLTKKKGGEAIGALHHKEIGDIDLVWGEEGTGKSDGYGLAKLVKYHPDVLENLQEILDDMHVTQRGENRVRLESDTHQAAVRLTWDNQKKNWLLTAFEKKNSVLDNTTDTGETSKGGERNDTATPQNTVSEDKGSEISANEQEKEEKSAGQPTSYQLIPTEYTTKRGKKLEMQLVKFDKELTKEQQRAANNLAKELKGWWSKDDGGFLMRDAESAEQ